MRSKAIIDGLVQREADRITHSGIRALCNQAITALWDSRSGVISRDSDLYIDGDDLPEEFEPMQAFIVDGRTGERLRDEEGEVVLEWGACSVWFRQGCGQAASMDPPFQRWAVENLLARRDITEEEAAAFKG